MEPEVFVIDDIPAPNEGEQGDIVGAEIPPNVEPRRNPQRNRNLPPHLSEYVVDDQVYHVDHCYLASEAKSTLAEGKVHSGESSTSQHFLVSDFMLPSNFKNTTMLYKAAC